jgi:hypothetical protein
MSARIMISKSSRPSAEVFCRLSLARGVNEVIWMLEPQSLKSRAVYFQLKIVVQPLKKSVPNVINQLGSEAALSAASTDVISVTARVAG